MKIDLKEIRVYYINLDCDTLKRERTENMLKSMGFKYVTRVPAIEHEKGRVVGCARSHHHILSSYCPPFIILEDDCTLNSDFDGFIDVPDNADAVYLGISHWGF